MRHKAFFQAISQNVTWFFFFFFFLSFIYFTSFGEKDKADMNSLWWSAPVGLEPAYTRMWVARSTTVLRTPTWFCLVWSASEQVLSGVMSRIIQICSETTRGEYNRSFELSTFGYRVLILRLKNDVTVPQVEKIANLLDHAIKHRITQV